MTPTSIRGSKDVFVLISLASLFFIGSGWWSGPEYTAEEAAYYEEVTPVALAACEIGETITVPETRLCSLMAPESDQCGISGTVTENKTYFVRSFAGSTGNSVGYGVRSWSNDYANLNSLLPPTGLESLHSFILASLRAELRLPKGYKSRIGPDYYGTQLTPPDRSLLIPAQKACAGWKAFVKQANDRPSKASHFSNSPAVSVTFQPIGTPVSLSASSQGTFSVSMSGSLPTPIGTFSVSASDSTGSSMHPTRLVILAFRHRRILMMDRPFSVYVPSKYGVSVSNDGHQLTLNVLGPPPKIHGKLRSKN